MFDSIIYLDKSIQPYVRQVLSYDQFGIFKEEVQLHKACTYSSDQFSLLIPYANKKLKWEVFFDLNHLQLGPDFNFDDDTFFTDPSARDVANNLPSLAHWDAKDPNALLNVIKELLSYYKQCQLKVCEELTDRLKLEYETLVSELTRSDDIEVVVNPDKNRFEASFHIFLNFNYSILPYRDLQPFKDLAILVITFQVPDCMLATPRLDLTEDLKETLQKVDPVEIPPIDGHMLLIDYVAEVRKIIEDKIKVISCSFKRKLEFVTLLRVYQSASILEYDSEEFRFITLLLRNGSLFFIVKFTLPELFPLEPPEVILYSVYHQSVMRVGHMVKNFDYDSSWTMEQIVASLFNHILDKEFEKFMILTSEKKPSY